MDPFHGVTDIISEINRMRQLGRSGQAPEAADRRHAEAWIPATDIFARGDDLVIQLELAGVPVEAVEITFAGGVLTVSGERERDPGDVSASAYVQERVFGAFRRSVALSAGVDDEDIEADFANGLVEVVVRGGAAPVRSRRIELRPRSAPS